MPCLLLLARHDHAQTSDLNTALPENQICEPSRQGNAVDLSEAKDLSIMGSQHKRHEGLKTYRRTAAKPKIEKKQAPVELTPLQQAHRTLSQELLDALATLVAPQLEDMETFTAQLQEIKQHFFKRNYELVFQNSDLCDVYAARYLPSRALAYADLFHSTKPVLDLLYPPPRAMRPSERRLQPAVQRREPVRITAVGAGVGSELCALQLLPRLKLAELDVDVDEDLIEVLDRDIEMEVIDNAEYAPFLSTLETAMADAFPPPKAKLGQCKLRYHQEDILQYGTTDAFAAMLSETTLLTFMFVFNELFAASRVDAMRLIEAISKNLPAGAHVLLIESAGDLSEVQVADGTMMVYRFWDHLPGFEQVVAEDRRWFRLDKALKYPLEMENVGYFTRLYKKL